MLLKHTLVIVEACSDRARVNLKGVIVPRMPDVVYTGTDETDDPLEWSETLSKCTLSQVVVNILRNISCMLLVVVSIISISIVLDILYIEM